MKTRYLMYFATPTRLITALLLLFFSWIMHPTNLLARDYSIGPAPAWVKTQAFEDDGADAADTDVSYLLFENQRNHRTDEFYMHHAIKVLNNSGVQNYSDISVEFDPTYEALTLHYVRIIRQGEVIEKLNSDPVQTFQREASLEQRMYDGRITASISVSDVRSGDVLEYAYTLKGKNPLYGDHFFGTLEFSYALGVHRIYRRILLPAEASVEFRNFNNPPKAKLSTEGQMKVFEYDVRNVAPIMYDNQVPSWYNEQDYIEYSTMKSWDQFGTWASDLFDVVGGDEKVLLSLVERSLGKELQQDESSFNALLNFVQNEIRYLGLEHGFSAYKPHAPREVIKQRFGDCKDKSLLLATLLRAVGIEAHPVLVSTSRLFDVSNHLPMPGLFDHCIIRYKWSDEYRMLDPTYSNQGGDAATLASPDYEMGFIVGHQTDGLAELPKNLDFLIEVEEELFVEKPGEGGAIFHVKTIYHDLSADGQRALFKNESPEALQRSYTQYYSNLYDGIEAVADIRFDDLNDAGLNQFITYEEYKIPNVWKASTTEEEVQILELYPMNLESLINFPNSPSRKAPYYTGIEHYKHKIIAHLPESWNIQDFSEHISGEGFDFVSEGHYQEDEQSLVLDYQYNRYKRYIDAGAVADFVRDHNGMRDMLRYELSYNRALASVSASFDWELITLAILLILIFGFGAHLLNSKFDPVSTFSGTDIKSIGGWLILPLLGLIINPILVLYDMITTGYFSLDLWSAMGTLGTGFMLVGAFEFIFNLVILVFTLLLLLQFLRCRTSLPVLIMIFYFLRPLFTAIDVVLAVVLGEGMIDITPDDTNEIMVSLLSAAIWIPYFIKSERVKATFVKQRRPSMQPAVDS